jgi:hypothetical protein
MAELPFPLDPLFALLAGRPGVRAAVLYFWEVLALQNPALFPSDDHFLSVSDDPSIVLYLSYDSHRRSALDLDVFRNLPQHPFSFLLAVAIQRRQYIDR